MRYVLFEPTQRPTDENVRAMLDALISGLKPALRPMGEMHNLADDEVPILSAIYMGANREATAAIVKSGRPYVATDHAWFSDPGIRGHYFRVVGNRYQPSRLVDTEPDWDRFNKLRLPRILAWRREGGKVLFVPHTDRIGDICGFSPANLELWLRWGRPFLNWQEDVTVRTRHPEEDGPRVSPEEAILSHRAVVGFNSEMLIRALRMGVPAVGHFEGSAVYAFNGLTPEDLDNPARLYAKNEDDITVFCARLATHYQGDVEELARPGFIEGLLERQLAA